MFGLACRISMPASESRGAAPVYFLLPRRCGFLAPLAFSSLFFFNFAAYVFSDSFPWLSFTSLLYGKNVLVITTLQAEANRILPLSVAPQLSNMPFNSTSDSRRPHRLIMKKNSFVSIPHVASEVYCTSPARPGVFVCVAPFPVACIKYRSYTSQNRLK